MWTPRPVRAFRYAGSVATSVLPSPVAISAILPSCSTMPPISWTSKCRMPTVRRAASRQTAKASGRTSSSSSPPSIRFLNSSDFARRPASSSGVSVASRALMASTTGIIRLTSRSCLVPKIFFSSASIMSASLYRARSRGRSTQKLASVPPRSLGDPIPCHHAGDLLHARRAGHDLGADAGPAGAHALGDPYVMSGAGRDRRQVRDAENLAALRGRGELLGNHRGDPPADARVDLVEDHGRHALGARQDGLEGEHRARELAARRDARERAQVLAGVRRQAELDPVEPARPDLRERRPRHGDLEAGALHAELAKLARRLAGELLGAILPALGELVGGGRELRLELAEDPLVLGQDLLVAPEALELTGGLVAEREYRRLGVTVLPLEPRERIEPLVERLEPAGCHRDAVPERADRGERVLDQRSGAVDRIAGRAERRIEAGEIAQQARRALQAAHRGAVVVVQEPRRLGQARREPLGVLEPPPLAPQLLRLARPHLRGVELRYLKAQQVLALGPVALGRPRTLELSARAAVLGEQVADAVAEGLGLGEPIQQVELPGRLEQALVLVLAVDLDQVIAEALEQRDRDRRVVDEGAVAAGARELPAHDQLPVIETKPGLVEHRRHRTARRHLEHRFDGRGVGVGADDVGLGARTTDQEDRVEEH